MYGSTAVDLYPVVSLCYWRLAFGYFLQEMQRVTIGDEDCRQMFLLFGCSGWFCYDAFGSIV